MITHLLLNFIVQVVVVVSASISTHIEVVNTLSLNEGVSLNTTEALCPHADLQQLGPPDKQVTGDVDVRRSAPRPDAYRLPLYLSWLGEANYTIRGDKVEPQNFTKWILPIPQSTCPLFPACGTCLLNEHCEWCYNLDTGIMKCRDKCLESNNEVPTFYCPSPNSVVDHHHRTLSKQTVTTMLMFLFFYSFSF